MAWRGVEAGQAGQWVAADYHWAMDFRDQFIKEALDKAVGRYRPERRVRSRLVRIAMIAAFALAAVLGLAGIFHYAMSGIAPSARDRKPISVELLPAPGKH